MIYLKVLWPARHGLVPGRDHGVSYFSRSTEVAFADEVPGDFGLGDTSDDAHRKDDLPWTSQSGAALHVRTGWIVERRLRMQAGRTALHTR
jgi:hypothetical protein